MLRSAGLFGAWRGGHDLLRSVDNNNTTTTMDLQQGLKVKRRAREGGLIMGALAELEKARSCRARECVKERSRLTIPSGHPPGHRASYETVMINGYSSAYESRGVPTAIPCGHTIGADDV